MADIEKDENTLGARLRNEVEMGDAVLVKRERAYESKLAPTRFTSKVHLGTHVI